MAGRPPLLSDDPADPAEVDTVGIELEAEPAEPEPAELDPAEEDARPLEKSGSPADDDDEPCSRPPLGEGIDGILPADDEDEDEDEDEEDEDDEEEDGIEGAGILLDWLVCVLVSHALSNKAVRPMASINRCCDIFILITPPATGRTINCA